ncbi:MAG: hypothetical protein GY804_02895 [Alphaproteobacteria bacterium]|nr:hypothetical protein [Alphaproteobacteria bacterium]
MRTIKNIALASVIALSLSGCSALSGFIPKTPAMRLDPKTNIQEGNNKASLVDNTTNGKGNVAHNNQQVVKEMKGDINQGITSTSLMILILIFGGICAGLLFLVGLLIERPRNFIQNKMKNSE